MGLARVPEPRMPKRGVALAAVILGLGLTGCGGSEVEYQEVPGDPAEITLPERTPAAAETDEAGTDDEAATEEATPTATATPADATGTTADPATTGETATAQETPAATAEDGPTTDEPPVPGSEAERFEDFCEQNAGAC